MSRSIVRTIMKNDLTNDLTKAAENLSYYRYLLPFGKTPEKKFVVLMHPRSGSTLLNHLLRRSPDIHCDGEFLMRRVLAPHLYAEARSRKAKKPIYGFKMTSWQITTKQRLASPRQLVLRLHDQGWQIIYLERNNILRQSMSLLFAKHKQALEPGKRGLFHHRASQGPLRLEKIHVDCDLLRWYTENREREMKDSRQALVDLPHLSLVYEEDLLRAEDHQRTADRIFDYLGAARVEVATDLVRTSTDRLADMIDNYDEVVRVLANTKYAAMLDDHSQESTLQVA
jgi:LPS sulfotransferase NodH